MNSISVSCSKQFQFHTQCVNVADVSENIGTTIISENVVSENWKRNKNSRKIK